jgi:hypothetical protein
MLVSSRCVSCDVHVCNSTHVVISVYVAPLLDASGAVRVGGFAFARRLTRAPIAPITSTTSMPVLMSIVDKAVWVVDVAFAAPELFAAPSEDCFTTVCV